VCARRCIWPHSRGRAPLDAGSSAHGLLSQPTRERERHLRRLPIGATRIAPAGSCGCQRCVDQAAMIMLNSAIQQSL
jgi:hypothetical protein